MEQKYKNKKVLILGLGLNEGGVGAARFFAKEGAEVKVTDIKSKQELAPSLEKLAEFKNITYSLGSHKNEDIDWADLIIRNPALKPDNVFRKYAEKSGKRVEMDMGIFLEFVEPSQIIGVTGTKGKTTTSSLIYETVKDKHPNSILAGNIGKSVLDAVEFVDKDTLVILELSSFQLEGFADHKISPKFALITNILPDHLNYYNSMEEYTQAKKIIAQFQTDKDYLFINLNDQTVNSAKFLNGLKAKLIKFSAKDLPQDFEPTLPGEHNLVNYSAALSVSKVFDISDEEALQNMARFTGAEFRLQRVFDEGRLKIYNDSAATNPAATIAALKAFNNCILICGGMDKGLPYEELAQQIDRSCKSVYFLDGDATEKIRPLVKHQNILRSTYSDFEPLLKDLRIEAEDNATILFSPAATSFNLFKNEFDRGKKFNEAVAKLFK
jgi:UDP-N-acetylmuramoylalanine--D-glutamate ligase